MFVGILLHVDMTDLYRAGSRNEKPMIAPLDHELTTAKPLPPEPPPPQSPQFLFSFVTLRLLRLLSWLAKESALSLTHSLSLYLTGDWSGAFLLIRLTRTRGRICTDTMLSKKYPYNSIFI